MHGCNDPDTAALGEDADNVQNFRAGRLNWKIADGAWIDMRRAMHHPAKRRGDFEFQPGVVGNPVRIVFEYSEAGAQPGQNFAGLVERDAGAHRQ